MKTTVTCVGLAVLWMVMLGASWELAAQDVAPVEMANASVVTENAAPTSQPSEAAMALLKDLEAAGEKFTAIKADIEYTVANPTLGDKETRMGYVLYTAARGDKPARFRIRFDNRQENNGPRVKDVMDYAFDGEWMSIADHANKKLQQIQIAAPGETVEPLRLGKGPFPLPFGQRVDDVLEFFDAATRDPQKTDPPNTRYLKLTPKPGKTDQVNFTEVEQWVDKETNLPVKLVAKEKNKTVTTVLFGKRDGDKVLMNTKPEFKDSDFKFNKPSGWQLDINRLEERKKATSH